MCINVFTIPTYCCIMYTNILSIWTYFVNNLLNEATMTKLINKGILSLNALMIMGLALPAVVTLCTGP